MKVKLLLFFYVVINYLAYISTAFSSCVFHFFFLCIKDPKKQVGGPIVHGKAVQNQPIGLHISITAATIMTRCSVWHPITLHQAKILRS